MKILFIMTALLTASCTHITADIGAFEPLNGTRHRFQGDTGLAKLEVSGKRAFNSRTVGYCAVLHISNYGSGPPFNDDFEDYVDGGGCGVIYELWRAR